MLVKGATGCQTVPDSELKYRSLDARALTIIYEPTYIYILTCLIKCVWPSFSSGIVHLSKYENGSRLYVVIQFRSKLLISLIIISPIRLFQRRGRTWMIWENGPYETSNSIIWYNTIVCLYMGDTVHLLRINPLCGDWSTVFNMNT